MPVITKLTALTVTAIIVFGTDNDILRALPLGLLAGVLTTIFVALVDRLLAQEPETKPQQA